MTMTVNVIGAGRVGRTLLRLMAAQDQLVIQDVASRQVQTAEVAVQEIGEGRAVADISDMSAADLWFLTVPDSRIAEVAETLREVFDNKPENSHLHIAVHCSGFHSADVMAPLSDIGWSLASAHPMLSFADPEVSAARFPGTWAGIEGDDDAVPAVSDLFEALGARTFPIKSEAKVLYHAAAVITNNFTTVLQGMALEAWEAAGVPGDVARSLNAWLTSTLENIDRFGPADALTGPAARGDRDVVAAQGQAVADWHPEAGQVYALLSLMAERLEATGTTRSGRPEDSRP